jgi:hypothetical protein
MGSDSWPRVLDSATAERRARQVRAAENAYVMGQGWGPSVASSATSAFTPGRRLRGHRISFGPNLERKGVRAETGGYLWRAADILPAFRELPSSRGGPNFGADREAGRWRAAAPSRSLSSIPMVEIVFVVEEAPKGGFTARAVDASIFTEADTLEELRANVRSAVECHFDGGQAPKVIRLHIVRDEILSP